MKIRLTNAKVFDPKSKFHLKTTDILIDKGLIVNIGPEATGGSAFDCKGRIVTPGFVDLFAHFNEPGLEHKEDIESGMHSAANGGFTDVCLIPNTQPPIETKGDVKFISGKSGSISLWPMAAVSEETKGENLTEILDLNANGAIAFTDGIQPIWNSELLLKALQYVQKFDGLIVVRPKEVNLSRHAQMHEGHMSTMLGLPGEPSLSEELAISRDLDILKYAGGRLHFSQISSENAVKLIKEAKDKGLQVTCDVSIHHLVYTDVDLESYDTNFKLDPPLRTEKDRKALIKGLKNGVIDAITSSHQPQDQECKQLEFDLADNGAIGLQTLYSMLKKIEDELPMEVAIEKLTHAPREIMGLAQVTIEEGSPAKLALLDPDEEWVLDHDTNKSKSVNSPLFGQKLKGRAKGVVNGEIVSLEKVL